MSEMVREKPGCVIVWAQRRNLGNSTSFPDRRNLLRYGLTSFWQNKVDLSSDIYHLTNLEYDNKHYGSYFLTLGGSLGCSMLGTQGLAVRRLSAAQGLPAKIKLLLIHVYLAPAMTAFQRNINVPRAMARYVTLGDIM